MLVFNNYDRKEETKQSSNRWKNNISQQRTPRNGLKTPKNEQGSLAMNFTSFVQAEASSRNGPGDSHNLGEVATNIQPVTKKSQKACCCSLL